MRRLPKKTSEDQQTKSLHLHDPLSVMNTEEIAIKPLYILYIHV